MMGAISPPCGPPPDVGIHLAKVCELLAGHALAVSPGVALRSRISDSAAVRPLGSAALRRSASGPAAPQGVGIRTAPRAAPRGVGRGGLPFCVDGSTRRIGVREASALSCWAPAASACRPGFEARPFCQSWIAFTVASDSRLPSIGHCTCRGCAAIPGYACDRGSGTLQHGRIVRCRSRPGRRDRRTTARMCRCWCGTAAATCAQAPGLWKQVDFARALSERSRPARVPPSKKGQDAAHVRCP